MHIIGYRNHKKKELRRQVRPLSTSKRFSNKAYLTNCRSCKLRIAMDVNKDGWRPYNLSGTKHSCGVYLRQRSITVSSTLPKSSQGSLQ